MGTSYLSRITKGFRSFGPYLLLELFMPGGTLLAFLLWLAQRRKSA